MAAARSDHSRAAVHIINLQDSQEGVDIEHSPHQVTISCFDADGLLEYITKVLGTGGSRVLDADVMLSTDGVVLERFVVKMNGRLRLDKLSKLIESVLARSRESTETASETQGSPVLDQTERGDATGPLYFRAPVQKPQASLEEIEEEIQSAVPLSQVIAGSARPGDILGGGEPQSSLVSRMNQMPEGANHQYNAETQEKGEPTTDSPEPEAQATTSAARRPRRPLTNHEATIFADLSESSQSENHTAQPDEPDADVLDPAISIIPFEELMLIETLGVGRVSTIYRAAWRRTQGVGDMVNALTNVSMVALKVAMVNSETQDQAHVDELKREADIAAMLDHPHVCDLVGVAADAE